MKQGLVRDAATAKVAAEINELLRGVDMALSDHIGHAEQGLYGRWGDGLAWDLSSLRARLEKVRELVNGAPGAPG